MCVALSQLVSLRDALGILGCLQEGFIPAVQGAGRIEKVRKPLPEPSGVEDGGMQKSHLRSTSLTPMIADGHWKDGHHYPRPKVTRISM